MTSYQTFGTVYPGKNAYSNKSKRQSLKSFKAIYSTTIKVLKDFSAIVIENAMIAASNFGSLNSLIRALMKRHIYLLVLTFFCSCGGEGHISYYNFTVSKAEVKVELNKAIRIGGHSARKTWNDYELGKRGDDIFVYFKSNPTELYLVGFNNYGNNPRYKDRTVLALVGVFDGKKWSFARDLNTKQRNRISERFQTEILSKMKYSYEKIDYP